MRIIMFTNFSREVMSISKSKNRFVCLTFGGIIKNKRLIIVVVWSYPACSGFSSLVLCLGISLGGAQENHRRCWVLNLGQP